MRHKTNVGVCGVCGTIWALLLVLLPGCAITARDTTQAAGTHVWEKVEITLHAANKYANPYKDAQVWVDLKGPGFDKRCYGFWDGGDTFRVRVMATGPGDWTWTSGSAPADAALAGKTGSFRAAEWSKAQKTENPNRRGMIRATKNGHAFEYADGTPFFYLADTWWATSTSRFKWTDGVPRGGDLSPDSGFKEFVAYRKNQEYNGVTILASLGNWAADGQPAALKTPDGTMVRSAWKEAGKTTAKDMKDEAGNRPFEFPGKVPGFENVFPDVERVNPAYFQSLDRKIDYLNAQGFVPFIEPARRDMGEAWTKYYPWPDSYSRFVEFVWSRYQANICFLSPIHNDAVSGVKSAEWNDAANRVIDVYGPPPFDTLASTNPTNSTLQNYGHTDKAKWLGFHMIGNLRTHTSYSLLTEIFNAKPPVPGLNGEPYYDGMESLEGGSDDAAMYCRSAMYGSVLSGGLGGHVYGAGGWDGGVWSGETEAASKYPIWKVMQWQSGNQMRFMKAFILSEGAAYQNLVPCREKITPHETKVDRLSGGTGWAFGAGTADGKLYMLYFEKDCPRATLVDMPAGSYSVQWFDPRKGEWVKPGSLVNAADGKMTLPASPGGAETATQDWAVKLKAAQ